MKLREFNVVHSAVMIALTHSAHHDSPMLLFWVPWYLLQITYGLWTLRFTKPRT